MLTSRQINLVEQSWDFVILNTEQAGTIFYNRLFEVAPKYKVLFKEDIASQSRKLVALISFAVHKLDSLEEIIADVQALGVRHYKYNVQPEDYATVGQTLLWTLQKALGARWNDEMQEAWTLVYTVLSTTMIEAAEEAKKKDLAA